jgi:hypothetical protein
MPRSLSEVPGPEEIFEKSRAEGERRLNRPFLELVATALAAGFDIAAGVTLLAVLSAPLVPHFGKDAASVAGAIGFGLGFVYLIVGRGSSSRRTSSCPSPGCTESPATRGGRSSSSGRSRRSGT